MSIGLGLGSDSLVVSESQLSAPLKIAGGSSLRSASSMQGLLLAEKGEAMVELVAGNGTSGFKEGTRINPGSITPRRHTFSAMEHGRSFEKTSLSRHGTLLSSNVTPGQNAAELKSLLGNSNARLRPGASIAPLNALSSESTSLEQAKRRARVEVDVIPETNVFVQGGYINGAVKIRIRPRSKTESGILISDGKIRVVGFECILNEEKRHTFYQQSALLSEASPAAISLYDSPPDNEGFYAAKDGVHVFPFSMYLTLEGGEGAPKGTLPPHAGIAVRYILMISVKVREIETDRRSIAHFYRDCEIWPRLNPSAILSPAAEPVRESAAKTFFMGGSGKVGLTASMHRLIWVAGQRCSIKVRVINKSKKTLKSLTLTLLRSTVIYKPNPQLDVDGSNEHDADACQTSTVQKSLAENVLQMGQRDRGRGHASAKGWWTGIGPDETREFYFFLSLPSDAITIPRAHLLEVAYKVRVTISAGTLASDLHVLLPIRIINFLSIDPPPTFPPEIDDIFEENANAAHTLGRRGLESLSEDDAKNNEYDEDDRVLETDNNFMSGCSSSSGSSESDDMSPDQRDSRHSQLGNVLARDDNDEFVQQAITSLRVDSKYGECGGRFADLYYSSVLEADRGRIATENGSTEVATPRPAERSSLLPSPHSSASSIPNLARSTPSGPRGPSSFTERVQQKLKDTQHVKPITDTSPNDSKLKLHPPTSSLENSKSSNLNEPQDNPIARKRSSTAGSYFRPRHEIPDEVEILNAEEQQLSDEISPRSPFAEISHKASELSSLTSGSEIPAQSSEALKKIARKKTFSPLLNAGIIEAQPNQTALTSETSTEMQGCTTTQRQPDIGLTRRRSHTLCSTLPSSSLPIADTQAPIDYPRSKAPLGGNSVKDRIRMLEEKARAEKGLEQSGHL